MGNKKDIPTSYIDESLDEEKLNFGDCIKCARDIIKEHELDDCDDTDIIRLAIGLYKRLNYKRDRL